MEVGDVVTVPFEATQPWEEWRKTGRIIIIEPPYCVVIVEIDPYHTERVTCRLDEVRLNPPQED